jgi:16S rRNA (guanine527-N7)-methyltransferase
LVELCGQYALGERQRSQLASLLATLEADPHAPTSVSEAQRAVDVHLADSLAALELPVVRGARAIADLGAGAGFPGLALAVALPAAIVTLVESSQRKGAFIERARAAAAIENARVAVSRAEAWRDGIGANDLVTARALAPLAVVCEYAAPLLSAGGTLVAWRGKREQREEAEAAAAAAELGLELTDVVRSAPYAQSENRHLYLYLKVRLTPTRYPRRPGMARKHPLGASS